MSEPAAPEQTPASKRSKVKLLVMILALGIVLGGGGLGAYMAFFNKDAHAEHPEVDAHAPKPTVPDTEANKSKIVTLKAIVVNLRDTRASRYLKVTIGLETSNEKVVAELNEIQVPLNDFFIDRLSDLKIEDVDNSQGRNKLKRELLFGANEMLKSGVINKLYFSEFVVQ
ncbi:MAG: hypothetical protein AMXMBFR7_31040 [Planctomycetota bacterium]